MWFWSCTQHCQWDPRAMRPLFLPSVLAPWGQCWTQDRKIPGNPWPLQILHHPASCEPRCLTAFSSWEKNKTQKGEPRKNVQIPTDMDCWTYTQICDPKTIVLSKNISCACGFSIQWIDNYRILSVWGAVYIQMINSQSPDAPGAGYLHVLSTYQGSAGGAFPPPCQKHSPPSASICKFEESNWLSYGSSWHLPTICYALFVFIYLGFIHT